MPKIDFVQSAALGAVMGALALALTGAAPPAAVTLERAAGHPMLYHLALPTGYTPGRTWPVVVVIPDAARDFEANLRRFVAARGDRPFLLVAPEVLSSGGARTRTPDHFSYAKAEWDSIAAGDDLVFDDAGLAAVLADVHARFGGEKKAFLTGWEAGGHTVWAQALRRPERWRAVAPVTTNYQRRGLTPETFSTAPERKTLPLRVFRCGSPSGELAGNIRYLDLQTSHAIEDARAHGFSPLPIQLEPGMDHGPLPEPVLEWFETLVARDSASTAR